MITYDEDKAYNQFPVWTATGETNVSGTTTLVGTETHFETSTVTITLAGTV